MGCVWSIVWGCVESVGRRSGREDLALWIVFSIAEVIVARVAERPRWTR